MSATTYLTCSDTAKLIRKALKREFPGVKFGVRSKTYSGGASIDVKWTDGPTPERVEDVAKRYQGATFDPMIDLKSYVPGQLSYQDDPARDGEAVHFGADFVFCERSFSEAFASLVRADLTAEYPGFDWPPVRGACDGWSLDWEAPTYYDSPTNGGFHNDCGYLFSRRAKETEG